MRVRTAVNGETLESQYPTAQLVQRYTLLIGSNHNREAYALVLKCIVNVVVDFSRDGLKERSCRPAAISQRGASDPSPRHRK